MERNGQKRESWGTEAQQGGREEFGRQKGQQGKERRKTRREKIEEGGEEEEKSGGQPDHLVPGEYPAINTLIIFDGKKKFQPRLVC